MTNDQLHDGEDRVFKTQMVPQAWQDRLVTMVLDKGLPVVLCLIAIYFLYTGLMDKIPEHIKALTDAGKQIAEEDRAARAIDTTKHLEAVKAVVEGAKDSQDRLERILTDKVRVVERKVQAVEKKTEGMEVN